MISTKRTREEEGQKHCRKRDKYQEGQKQGDGGLIEGQKQRDGGVHREVEV